MRFSVIAALSTAFAFAAHVPTGPDVGATVPHFELTDRTGAKQTLASLSGPKGLLLLFFRSADW
jgi:hypothetical protein